MKKSIFKFLSIAAVIIGLSTPQHMTAQNVVDNKSLSIALGANIGGGIVNQLNYIDDETFKSKLSKEEIIVGFEYVLANDTDNVGMHVGLSMGMQLAGQIAQLEQLGAKIDKKIVLEEFNKALLQEYISSEEISKYKEIIELAQNMTAQNVVDNKSLSIALGANMGGQIVNQLNYIDDETFKSKLSKEEIIVGFEYVLAIDTDNVGMQVGLSMGMQLAGQIAQLEQLGAKIDKKIVLEEFNKALLQEYISSEEISKYKEIIELAQNNLNRKLVVELENTPEAIQGKKTGEEYIANLKKKDKKIKTSSSGLSYKIINKGNGRKITNNDYVKVAYKGSLIDGTVFDDSNGKYREFPVAGVVPGLSEGLKLLNKGGKAIFYIPGNLGYGPQGLPAAGIGPNQMLIFEVKLGY